MCIDPESHMASGWICIDLYYIAAGSILHENCMLWTLMCTHCECDHTSSWCLVLGGWLITMNVCVRLCICVRTTLIN